MADVAQVVTKAEADEEQRAKRDGNKEDQNQLDAPVVLRPGAQPLTNRECRRSRYLRSLLGAVRPALGLEHVASLMTLLTSSDSTTSCGTRESMTTLKLQVSEGQHPV
jgi:hypothetical protein